MRDNAIQPGALGEPFAISPRYTTEDWSALTRTIDGKIRLFDDRVQGWQLDIARQLITRNIPHRDFALLHIVTSYFEMVAKYKAGYTENRESEQYFRKGVSSVFPALEEWPSTTRAAFLKAFYRKVRNGLYHAGLPHVTLYDGINAPIAYDDRSDEIAISPRLFLDTLEAHFHEYMQQLGNPGERELRANFERRFNHDNGLQAS